MVKTEAVNKVKNTLIKQSNLQKNAFKTALKREVQKAAEALVLWLVIKLVMSYDGKITKISKTSQQNNTETSTNEHDKKIHKEINISLEKRKKIIDDLGLM